MFKKAIKESLNYLRPLATGHLYYDKHIINGISSLMVINKKGDLLTCAHIADLFEQAEEINEVFIPILKEIKNAKDKDIKKLEKKYGIEAHTLIGLYNILIDICNNPGKLKIIRHEYLDLAIIRIQNNDNLLIDKFPKFLNKITEIGTSVCKVGFAFPEYSAFVYDEDECRIKTNHEVMNFPIFPLEGMITRNIADEKKNITMLEISSMLVPGQEGGALVDVNGNVLGMLLGNKRIISNDETDFRIDLTVAINSQTIIKFLNENKIEFEEVI